jgi:hypothetical protein
MAKTIIPDPMARRHLAEKEMGAEQCLALADAYLEEGRAAEAVVFLVKANADDRIEELMQSAIRDGDAFLLKLVVDESRRDCGPDRWLALAEAADAIGKLEYGEMARRHARSSEE